MIDKRMPAASRNHVRAQSGMALPMILALGVVASLWMLGTAAMVIPSLGRIATERSNDIMREIGESAVDWAVAQENNPNTQPNIDPMTLGSSKTVAIPASINPYSAQGYSGTITVFDTMPPTYSYLYSPGFSGGVAGEGQISGSSGFRVVTAAVSGPNGRVTKNIRVLLMPFYTPTDKTTTTSTTSTTQGPPESIFKRALFAPGAIGGAGNMVTNSYNSASTPHPTSFVNQYADVGTNTSIAMGGNSSIGGNLTVTSTGTTGQTVATGTANSQVYGNVAANGVVSGINDSTGTITQNANSSAQQLPPVPSAPSVSTNIGTVSLQTGNTLTLGTNYYTMNGIRYSASGNSGNYVVNSISMAGNSSISVDATGGPVNVYVQGSGSNNGISFGGNGVANASGIPSNFRLWYNGSGGVNFAGNGTITGVIYAPNAQFSVANNGVVYGAVVANTVNMAGNGTFHYDQALSNNSSLSWNPPQTTSSSSTTTSKFDQFTHFSAVSWSEF